MTYKKTFMASIEVWAFILMIFSVAQTTHHVRVGTNTSICGFICEQPNGILLLQCRHKHSIFVAECINSTPEVKRKDSERLNLNLSSGCFLMTDVQKNDSCVYEIWFHDNKIHIKKSITIIILDAIQILNISSTFSHMGSDFSVHVQFSGAEATVSWEVDGIASPSRYELVDNNRTLIIRGAKDEDTKRKFVVRLKNPISEDVREYCLKTQGEISVRTHLELFITPTLVIVVAVLICYKKLNALLKTKDQTRMQGTKQVVNEVSEV